MRARARHLTVGVSALVLSAALPSAGLAQLTATPQQDLSFGLLTPGVPATVLVDDAARRAEWVLLGGRGNTTLTFVLPESLVSPGGAAIPLVFADGDAGMQRTQGNTTIQLLDPTGPVSITIPNRQQATLYLGGTAQPTPDQAAGTYTATITVIVADP